MNPFLQAFWPDVHTKLITYIADALAEQLPPGLKARAEEKVTLAAHELEPRFRADVAVVESWKQGVPPRWEPAAGGAKADVDGPGLVADEPIYCIVDEETDRWVEIFDPNGRVITVIEVLSPVNKAAGHEVYRAKIRAYIEARVSVVEIDLLRGGHHVLNIPRAALADPAAPYLTCVTRSTQPNKKEYYQTRLDTPLPNIRIPLRAEDPDAVLPLQSLIDRCYRMGAYWNESHTRLPGPPLEVKDAEWVAEKLRQAGFSGEVSFQV